MKAVCFVATILLLVSGNAFAQQDPDDPGRQDSVIVDQVRADSGASSVWVPLYILADDRIGFFNFPMAYDSGDGIYPDSVVFFDDEGCMTSSYYSIFPEYIRILGWFETGVDTIRCPNPFPRDERYHFVSVRFAIEPDAPSQVITLDTTWDDRNGSMLFGLEDGITAITPGFAVSYIVYGHPAGIDEPGALTPDKFTLMQNYPNPFNSSSIIRFDLKESSRITLDIYDLLGRHITVLANSRFEPGSHSVIWDGRDESKRDVPSGVYFYRLTSAAFSDTKRMTLLR
jgi:hypothetical protein